MSEYIQTAKIRHRLRFCLNRHDWSLFIINEHDTILNMKRGYPTPDLDPYRAALERWMPGADLRLPKKPWQRFDRVMTWKALQEPIRYLVEEKRHLRNQDVRVVVEQLRRRRTEAGTDYERDRILLLAPHIRAEQAAVLEQAQIDYLDLAGNAHLQLPGLFVHVEGRRPTKEALRAPRRPNKAWIKTIMALLVRQDLVTVPYRILAEQADVALGTVGGCMNDLITRGLVRAAKHIREITDRGALVALWVQAYVEVLRPKLNERRFQIRAATKQEIYDRLDAVLKERRVRWALTGADAAQQRKNFFRAEETEIYAPPHALEDRATQKALVAQPAGRGGNLLIIEPPGPLAILARATEEPPLAPDLLTYAELRYRGTDQALEAAEMILPRVLNDETH
jgi:hypothetical protein